MQRLRVFGVAPLLAIMFWVGSVGLSAATAQTPAPTSGPIDQRVCTDLMTTLKQWAKTPDSDRYLNASRKDAIGRTPLEGCTWRVTAGAGKAPDTGLPVTSRSGPLITASATAPFCQGYYRDYGIYDPWGFPIMVGITNTGWCSNGYSYMWVNWGPDCWMSTYPIYGTSITWCGWGRWPTRFWSDGNCHPQSGMNWNWWDWKTPWWVRGGSYMRTQVVCYGPGGSITWGYAYDY